MFGISTLKFQHLDELSHLICRIQDWPLGDEITNAGGACHRVVSPLLHRCARLRQMVDAAADMDPALRAFVLLYVWSRVDESVAEEVHRDTKHESSRASGTGHAIAAATVRHEQTETCGGCWVCLALVHCWRTVSVLGRWQPTCPAVRGDVLLPRDESFESASREIYRLAKWSWTDWSHLHCLFGEQSLNAVRHREDSEALCVDYVR